MIRNSTTTSKPRTSNSALLPMFSGLLQGLQSKSRQNEDESFALGLIAYQNGEGVSTVSANLAHSFSFDLEQEILVLGANAGDGTLNKMLDVKSTAGLNDVIERTVAIDEAIVKSPKGDLLLMNHGVASRKSFSPYLVSRFKAVLDQLRNQHQVIVVDLPALEKPSHATAIAAQLDGVVLVVDSTQTRKEQCVEAKRLLERNGANLVGIILNRQS